MSKLVVGVALAAVAVAVLLLSATPPDGKAAAAEKTLEKPASVSIRFGLLADSGNLTSAVLGIGLSPENEEGRLLVFCRQKPIWKSAIILDYPQAPGLPRNLSDEVAAELARCGMSSRKADAEDASSSPSAVVIAPTGAVPSSLADRAEGMAGINSRVIVLVSLPGRRIDSLGRLEEGQAPPSFELVEILPGRERQAACDAARKAIGEQEEDALVVQSPPAALSVAVYASRNATYCRAIYISERACRVADIGPLEPKQGRLYAPQRATAGQPVIFEFSLPEGREAGRSLRFSAVSYLDGKEVGRKEIAGGTIAGGWASRFALNFSKGGKYTVVVVDQFSREHAAAYLEVSGLSILPVRQEGNRYEFYAEFGGKPAVGAFDVWLDGGGKGQFYSSNGTLVVWASPQAGKRTMHFSFLGLHESWDFEAAGGGVWEAYVRLGLPAVIFLAAVFFLLRARKEPRYVITFPEFAHAAPKAVELEASDFERAWAAEEGKLGRHSLPLHAEEIARGLFMGRQKPNIQSVYACLRQLCKEGRFAECGGGLFIPRSKMGGFSPSQLSSLRLLHDIMLERGLRFLRSWKIRVGKAGLEICVFRGKRLVLEGISSARRAILFADEEERRAFEQSLEENDAESIRIKIALENGRLILVCAKRQEIEAVLP
ncbi:MAG: hypothetical protein N3E51_04610 [Candidatus Micrarchaeota archaeon]|nr:hypothetical protein [Candidatus Micrarchaeota archaeon]